MPSSWETCMVMPLQWLVIMTLWCHSYTVYKYQIWKNTSAFFVSASLFGQTVQRWCNHSLMSCCVLWLNIPSWIFCLVFLWCVCLFTVPLLWFEPSSHFSQPSSLNACRSSFAISWVVKVCFMLKGMYVCVHQYFYLNPVQLALFCLSLNYIEFISTLFRNNLRAASITVWYHNF